MEEKGRKKKRVNMSPLYLFNLDSPLASTMPAKIKYARCGKFLVFAFFFNPVRHVSIYAVASIVWVTDLKHSNLQIKNPKYSRTWRSNYS